MKEPDVAFGAVYGIVRIANIRFHETGSCSARQSSLYRLILVSYKGSACGYRPRRPSVRNPDTGNGQG
jgi:hypothetical protein